MFALFASLAAWNLSVSAASAEPLLEGGFDGALRGCEEWLLTPASWTDGTGPFVAAVGLGEQMTQVDAVAEENLPPPTLRRSNYYWRINSTPGAGYVLVVSNQLPMCHITGGGEADLQPSVEAVLSSTAFGQRWERQADEAQGDMATTVFRNRRVPALSIVISRPRMPAQRRDRVQILATAIYRIGG